VEQGLGSSTWWDEAEYRQLGTVNDRALFILDKLIKRDTPKFQAAWAAAFPERLMYEPRQIQSDEVTRGPWLVILTRMGATRRRLTFWNGWGIGGRRGARPARLGGLMKPIQIDLARVADVPLWRAYELERAAALSSDATRLEPSWPTSPSVVQPIAIAPRELGVESY
jgi:hypothetical protein